MVVLLEVFLESNAATFSLALMLASFFSGGGVKSLATTAASGGVLTIGLSEGGSEIFLGVIDV